MTPKLIFKPILILFELSSAIIYSRYRAILSIIFCDQQSASGTISIRVNDGSNDVMLISGQAHGSGETFIFNDKFVLEEDDDIDVYNSVTNGDWYISYIDQDWT